MTDMKMSQAGNISSDDMPTWALRQASVAIMKEFGLTAEHIHQRLKGEISVIEIRGLLLSGEAMHRSKLQDIFNSIIPFGYSIHSETTITLKKPS